MPIGAFRLNGLGKFQVTAAAEVIRYKKSVIAVGNAQIDTAQSKFGGASALFDGTGDYLIISPYSDIAPGTNDFCFEGWFRIPNNNVDYALFGCSGTNGDMVIRRVNDGTIRLGRDDTAWDLTSSVVSIANTWAHIAVCRSGSTAKIFLNGSQVATGTNTQNYVLNDFRLGDESGFQYNGHMDEIRVSNIARYTANFTVPTEPFVNDANTVLLLHMDGTDAITFFEDDNGVRGKKSLIAFGNTQIDNAQSKFGGTSALFDGTGDYLRYQPSTTELQFSTDQDFTIELFVRMNANNNTRIFWTLFDGTTARAVLYTTSTQLSFYAPALGGVSLGDFPSTGVWYHLAVSRSGNTTKIFYNGTETYSTTTAWTGTADRISFGTDNESTVANPYNGWMDEIRVSNTARYTSTFTPTASPFVNDTNTLLLVHCSGTDGSSVFIDDNGTGRAQNPVAAIGNAQIDTADSKFGGSSALFDGTGDYLTVGNTGFEYTSGQDVTMECWFKLNSGAFGEYNGIIAMGNVRGSASKEWNIFVMINSATSFNRRVVLGYNYSIHVQSATNLSLNTWYHVAATRSGSTITLWLNGVSQGTTTSTATLGQNTGFKVASFADGTLPTYCWIDEVRVSNIARYTAGFTPSTVPFRNDANTQLLLHCDGTDALTVFVDDNGVTPT